MKPANECHLVMWSMIYSHCVSDDLIIFFSQNRVWRNRRQLPRHQRVQQSISQCLQCNKHDMFRVDWRLWMCVPDGIWESQQCK